MVLSCALLGLSIAWLSFLSKGNSEYIINKGETLECLLYTVCVYGGISNLCSAHGFQEDSWKVIIAVIAVLIVWSIFLYASFSKEIDFYFVQPNLDDKDYNPVLSIFVCPLIIAYIIIVKLVRQENCMLVFPEALDETIKQVITFPIAPLAYFAIKKLFMPIKWIDKTVSISKRLRALKMYQYIKIFFLSCVCLVWLLNDIRYNARALDKNFSTENIGLFLLVFAVLGLAIVSSLIIRKVENKPFKMILTSILTIVIYVFLIVLCPINHSRSELTKELCDGVIAEIFFSPYIFFAVSFILQISGVSFMVRQSFFANAYFIRGYGTKFKTYGKKINILSFAIMIANSILLFLTTVSCLAFASERIPLCEILLYIIIMFLGSCIFPSLIYIAIGEKLPEHSLDIVNGDPTIEIAKDGMCAYFIYLLGAGIPIYFIKYTKTDDPRWIILCYCLFIMGSVYCVLKMCIKNNNEHLIDLVKRNLSNGMNLGTKKSIKKMKRGMMQNLYKHLFVQNIFAMISTLLYSFIFFVLLDITSFIKQILDEGKLTFVQVIEKFREYCTSTFLPNKDLIKHL